MGGKGATGCDVGYVHSIVKAADWAKIPGGRPAGFSTCNTLSSHVGNTCCTKVDPTVRAKACVLKSTTVCVLTNALNRLVSSTASVTETVVAPKEIQDALPVTSTRS